MRPGGTTSFVAHAEHMWQARAMAKMIQVRNVPERLHRTLVERARHRGLSLTDYVEEILEREVSRPPADEVFGRIASRSPVDLGTTAADLLREDRRSETGP